MKFVVMCSMLAFLPLATPAEPRGTPAPLVASIDGHRRFDPVTPYEFGMFIEPIGNLVARTLWAEMLDDRKF